MTRTILVVDDEPVVLNLAKVALERNGHHVLAARSPAEALRLCEMEPRVDVLLADASLPAMSGIALAAAVKHSHPNVRLLLMSGWPYSMLLANRLVTGAESFLAKPFPVQQLEEAIRDVLNHPQAPKSAISGR